MVYGTIRLINFVHRTSSDGGPSSVYHVQGMDFYLS